MIKTSIVAEETMPQGFVRDNLFIC